MPTAEANGTTISYDEIGASTMKANGANWDNAPAFYAAVLDFVDRLTTLTEAKSARFATPFSGIVRSPA